MNDKVVLGDCLEVMKDLPDDCVDAIVTDPPYGLEFMGKDWDKFGKGNWQAGGGFTKPGIGERERAWPSFSATGKHGAANPTCGTCGGRARGKKSCSCVTPNWKPIGKRRNAENEGLPDDMTGSGASQHSRAFQDFNLRWAAEALRVAKPGAYLLAFGGTRMYHRLAVAIEDAGWELRDCFSYLYGSGFPKSLDVSKAISKRAGGALRAREAIDFMRAERERLGLSRIELETRIFGRSDGNVRNWEDGISIPVPGLWPRIREALGLASTPFDSDMERGDVVVGQESGSYGYQKDGERWIEDREVREPATDAAKRWAGFGTALKPAWEPIIVARKPLISTVAANVLKHGTGGINIDGCRIETSENLNGGAYKSKAEVEDNEEDSYQCIDPNCPDAATMPYHDHPAEKRKGRHDGTENWRYKHGGAGGFEQPKGRWPANVILGCACEGEPHDPGCAVRMLDEQTGFLCPPGNKRITQSSFEDQDGAALMQHSRVRTMTPAIDSGGGASRFFYTAKASRSERTHGGTVENKHPTVKPISLMRYLVRLVTPPGGSVLDPFCGSGSGLVAADLEGFDYLGIEQDPESHKTACERLANVEVLRKKTDPKTPQAAAEEEG